MFLNIFLYKQGFPGDSDGKESACNAGDWVRSMGWEDPLEQGMATHSSILAWKNSHEQRNLEGYTPWGGKESNMTERLSTAHITFKDNFPFTVIKNIDYFPHFLKNHFFIWLCCVLTATRRD